MGWGGWEVGLCQSQNTQKGTAFGKEREVLHHEEVFESVLYATGSGMVMFLKVLHPKGRDDGC